MRFWLGGYTADMDGAATGIGVLRAGAPDDVLAGGDLAFAGTAVAAASPSWIAAHPTLDVLYAAQEGAGTVQAFVRTGEESFAPLSGSGAAAVDAGALVCHIAVAPDGASLIASCWGDGRVVRYPLGPDGRIGRPRVAEAAVDPYGESEPDGEDAELEALAALADLAGFSGAGGLGDLPLFGQAPPDAESAVPASARVSRAHQARFLPGGVTVTTDMGLDLVRFWAVAGGELRETQRVVLPRGSGPRHTVWHPSGHLYVVTELSHEVFVLTANPSAALGSRWRIVSATSLGRGTVPGSDFAAEIALTRDAEYAVVGIRGSNTLASLRVLDGGAALRPVAIVDAGVDWPRHHVIERDTVLVAGQLSNEVASLAIDERTGVVGRVRRRVEVPSPTALVAARR